MSELLTMPDGMFHFKVQCRDGSAVEHSIDVLMLRLTCRECETANNLEVDENGCYVHTAAFLKDLARRLQEAGVEGCSPSVAYQLWLASVVEFDRLKKNTSETPSSPIGSTSPPEASTSEPPSDY